MRRRIVTATLAVAAGILAACTDKLPTSPTVNGEALKASINVDGCVDQTLILAAVNLEVQGLITNLFSTDNHRSSTATMWEGIKKDKLEGRPLQNHIDNLTKWTLEKLSANLLTDPDGAGLLNATTGSVRLLDLVFRCAGETPTQVPAPPAGFDALFKLVAAGEFGTFTTSFNDAAAFIPEGALEDNTLLVLVRQPDDVLVNTPFPKVSRIVDVALAGGKVKPGQNLSVLFCPFESVPEGIRPRLVVAHQFKAVAPGGPVGEGVEYLPPNQGGELDCPHGIASIPQMEKNAFKRGLMHAASWAGKAIGVLGPKTLYAGHAAIGGLISFSDDPIGEGGSELSPMVVVDPFVETSITDVSIPTTTYGETVEFDATLRVTGVPVACAPGQTTPAVCTWVGQPVTQTLAGMPELLLADLKITAALQDQSQSNPINTDGKAHFTFTSLDAGDAPQTATLTFPPTLNDEANAPSFGGSNTTAQYTVNRRLLSVTADANEWVYGTAETVTGTFTSAAVQYGESVTPTYTTTQNALTEVGEYPDALVADVIYGAGVRPENYALTKTNAMLTVIKAALSVTADNKSRLYGSANPTLTGVVTGIMNGDAHVATYTTGADATSDVSPPTYPITPSITGARLARNYDITLTNGALTINPAPLNVTINNESRPYGDPNPGFTTQSFASQVKNGDALSIAPSSAAGTLTSVGTYPITGTVTGDEVGNYAVTVTNGTLTITHRTITVTADTASRLVGASDPSFSGVVVGTLVPGDGVAINYSTTANGSSIPGAYPITPALLGTAASNYDATLNNGTLTVVATSPSIVTLTVSSTDVPLTGAGNYTALVSSPGPLSSGWDLQGWLVQGATTEPAGGIVTICGAGNSNLPRGNCTQSFSINPGGALVAGAATFRLELRQNGVVVDSKTVLVNLVP